MCLFLRVDQGHPVFSNWPCENRSSWSRVSISATLNHRMDCFDTRNNSFLLSRSRKRGCFIFTTSGFWRLNIVPLYMFKQDYMTTTSFKWIQQLKIKLRYILHVRLKPVSCSNLEKQSLDEQSASYCHISGWKRLDHCYSSKDDKTKCKIY